MSVCLRIILMIFAVLNFFYIIRKIRKSQMKIGDTIYWVLVVTIILILSFIPEIGYVLADMLGVESPVNLVYLVVIFLLLWKCFILSLKNSQLEYKIALLAEEIAIWRNEMEQNRIT